MAVSSVRNDKIVSLGSVAVGDVGEWAAFSRI